MRSSGHCLFAVAEAAFCLQALDEYSRDARRWRKWCYTKTRVASSSVVLRGYSRTHSGAPTALTTEAPMDTADRSIVALSISPPSWSPRRILQPPAPMSTARCQSCWRSVVAAAAFIRLKYICMFIDLHTLQVFFFQSAVCWRRKPVSIRLVLQT